MESEKSKRPYDINQDAWAAYNKLLWCNEPIRISKVTDQLTKLITSSNSSEPLQVLVLGIGVGTYDLPFLAHLEKSLGRSVRIVAIDLHKEPLFFTSQIFAEGLSNLTTSTKERIERINSEKWEDRATELITNSVFSEGNNLFICDSLNQESDLDDNSDSVNIDNASVRIGRPSQWRERLESTLGIPKENDGYFDLVLTSFCLHHLDWWRSTVINAIDLLKEGGIFLYSRLEGDIELLQGRVSQSDFVFKQQSSYTSTALMRHSNELLKTIFSEFFRTFDSDAGNPAGATHPFGLDGIMSHFEAFGVDEIDIDGYFIENEVDYEAYIKLLENFVFTPFLKIKKELVDSGKGLGKYNDFVEELKNRYSTNPNVIPDYLLFFLNWSGY